MPHLTAAVSCMYFGSSTSPLSLLDFFVPFFYGFPRELNAQKSTIWSETPREPSKHKHSVAGPLDSLVYIGLGHLVRLTKNNPDSVVVWVVEILPPGLHLNESFRKEHAGTSLSFHFWSCRLSGCTQIPQEPRGNL